MLLFSWARPTLFLPGPAHARPRATRAPSSAARWAPPGTIAVAHPSASPSPSVRPAEHARRTSHAPADFGPLSAGHRSPVGRDPPCSCRFLHVSTTSPDPPPRFLPPSAPLKRAPRRPSAEFFSPARRFVSPVHARAPHARRHRPGVHLAGFAPPETLLRAELHPSVTVVRPPPVSAPSSCSFPRLTAASSPPGLPRAAGPSHPRRRPSERPRRAGHFPSPHRRPTSSVSPISALLAP
jgi:hypothetical protein